MISCACVVERFDTAW